MRPTRCPRRGLRQPDAARAAQGHPEVPAPRSTSRTGGSLERVPGHARRDRTAELVDRARRGRPGAGSVRSRSSTSIPTARTSCSPPSLPALRPARAPAARQGGTARRGGAAGARAGVRRRAENRRHKPGGRSSAVDYRFDVLSDYGAFRDLQRHRLLTIEWQRLTPRHGYVRPSSSTTPGWRPCSTRRWRGRPASTRRWWGTSRSRPRTRCRWPTGCATSCSSTPREAIHLLELRSGRPGPSLVPPHRARDAPPDRRAGRAPCRRRSDEPLDDRHPRARAPRVGAPGRGASYHVTASSVTVVTNAFAGASGTDA